MFVVFLPFFYLFYNELSTSPTCPVFWEYYNHQVAGHFSSQYSIQGADYGADYGQTSGALGVYRLKSNLHWSQAGVNWMMANRYSGGSTPNKPALVWHHQTVQGGTCGANAQATGWTNSNLPGFYSQLRSHCFYNDEVRIVVGNLPSLQWATWHNYWTDAEFMDRSGQVIANNSQFTIDTYWLDGGDSPSSNGGASATDPNLPGRDSMDKLCANQGQKSNPNPPKLYYNPSPVGSTYTC